MTTTVTVSKYPDCYFCVAQGIENKALHDGIVKLTGRWAFMCQEHFEQLGSGLGTGKGQRLVEGKEVIV